MKTYRFINRTTIKPKVWRVRRLVCANALKPIDVIVTHILTKIFGENDGNVTKISGFLNCLLTWRVRVFGVFPGSALNQLFSSHAFHTISKHVYMNNQNNNKKKKRDISKYLKKWWMRLKFTAAEKEHYPPVMHSLFACCDFFHIFCRLLIF